MRNSKQSISIFLALVLSGSILFTLSPSVAFADCVSAAYPPVICANSSSDIPVNVVDQSVAATVAKFEAASPPPVGTSAKAVITIPVSVIDPATGDKTTINVIETIKKETSSTGEVTFSRTLTAGNTTLVISGGSGSAFSTTINANQFLTASVSGFRADTYVDIYIYSTQIYLGSFKVDSDGEVVDHILIPAKLANGNHSLVFAGIGAGGEKYIVPVPLKIGSALPNSGKKLTNSVFFSAKSGVIQPSQKVKLKELKNRIPKLAKNIQVNVLGYSAKRSANAQAAKSISALRANAVEKYLIGLGINKSSFSVKGSGWYGLAGQLGNRVDIQITWK